MDDVLSNENFVMKRLCNLDPYVRYMSTFISGVSLANIRSKSELHFSFVVGLKRSDLTA